MPEKFTDSELDILFFRTKNCSAKELRRDLNNNAFSERERPYIEGFIRHKIKEERNTPIKLYHRRKAPTGRIFKAYEKRELELNGWVVSPLFYREDFRDKLNYFKYKLVVFWCKEYKWILGFIVTLIALYLAYLKLVTPK